jgi:hypothetical protein
MNGIRLSAVKNTLLIGIILLLVNASLMGLAYFATFIGFLQHDYILTIIFGSLAFIGIVLQPWSLLFTLAPGYFILPIGTTVISLIFYSKPSRRQFLIDFLHRWDLENLRKVIIVILVSLIFLGGVYYFRFIDFPVLRQQVPPPLAWKSSIKGVQQNKSYCYDAFIDSGWLWQAKVGEEQMALIISDLGMLPLPVDKLPEEFFAMSPYWWRPIKTPSSTAYATNGVVNKNLDASRGLYAVVLYDPQTEILYGVIQDNF